MEFGFVILALQHQPLNKIGPAVQTGLGRVQMVHRNGQGRHFCSSGSMFQLDVSLSVYNSARGAIWLVSFQRNIDSKCSPKAVRLEEVSFQRSQGF